MMQKKIETFEQQLTDTQKSLEEKVDQLAETVITTQGQQMGAAKILEGAIKTQTEEARREDEEKKPKGR